MRMFRRLGILGWAGLACIASPVYTVTDLGSLGGSTTTAFGLSSNGLAAGSAEDPQGNIEALLFGGASVTSLWTAGEATGINSSGLVTGTVSIGGTTHGVIWSAGGTVDLGSNTSAAAINDAGQVAGSGSRAFLYQSGARTDIGTLSGGNWTLAEGISGNGAVAGYGDTRLGIAGFVWTTGNGLRQLGTLGGNNSYGMAVDDSGEVTGSAAISSGYLHAASWTNGAATDLGTLGGDNSYAYGINNAGAIVGYSWIAGSELTHAFIDLNGVMVDLNSLLPPSESGWVITAAYGINDQNQIVGEAIYHGQSHAVLLNDPPSGSAGHEIPPESAAPEPGTLILISGGLILGGVLRSRFNQSH